MRCGCAVAASDIPVHREIYEDAAIYFNPYAADTAAHALRSILAGADVRGRLLERGRSLSQRYLSSNILPSWLEFFESASRRHEQRSHRA
jgi:glycosyltransferase involved in cell wall biosynthesis